ncbi:MAG: hypothetical protein KC933_13420 [Myxococcales bacterium]|nr:hypothetical protein [Myxococcales bacterium]MCB9648204.1 hypothetical protein [Deltaproteobacteria bacterium]
MTTTAKRARSSTKTTDTKKGPAKKAQPRKARVAHVAKSNGKAPEPRTTPADTPVARVFEILPARVQEVSYVTRTRDILIKRRRRITRTRLETRHELEGVLSDLKHDVEETVGKVQKDLLKRFEVQRDKALDTKAGHRLEAAQEKLTEAFDGWLGKLGLVRKATLAA